MKYFNALLGLGIAGLAGARIAEDGTVTLWTMTGIMLSLSLMMIAVTWEKAQ